MNRFDLMADLRVDRFGGEDLGRDRDIEAEALERGDAEAQRLEPLLPGILGEPLCGAIQQLFEFARTLQRQVQHLALLL